MVVLKMPSSLSALAFVSPGLDLGPTMRQNAAMALLSLTTPAGPPHWPAEI